MIHACNHHEGKFQSEFQIQNELEERKGTYVCSFFEFLSKK